MFSAEDRARWRIDPGKYRVACVVLKRRVSDSRVLKTSRSRAAVGVDVESSRILARTGSGTSIAFSFR